MEIRSIFSRSSRNERNGYIVASLSGDKKAANGNLIASAPELLEALQNAIKFINLSVPHERQPKGLERWESAINKALGINQQNK